MKNLIKLFLYIFFITLLVPSIVLSKSQESYYLSADKIIQDDKNQLVHAIGNVELLKGAIVLRADKLLYEKSKNIVTAIGKVSLLGEDGSVIFAKKIRLNNDLKEGVIQSIGVLMQNKTRIAARNGILKKNGSEIEYKNLVFTSCHSCKKKKRLLWKIKAKEATHFKNKKTIFYRNVTLEAFGIPIAYTPVFYHPDPSVKRKSGLLNPKLGSSSIFGNTYKQPVYLALSDNSDLTLTPKLTTNEGLIFDSIYRKKSISGETLLSGSITHGTKTRQNEPDKKVPRGHIDIRTAHRISKDWTIGSDISRASDTTYLARYGFGRGGNVLTQNAYLKKENEGNDLNVNIYHFQTLSSDIEPGKVPFIRPHINYKWTNLYSTKNSFFSALLDIRSLKRENDTSTNRIISSFTIENPYISKLGYLINSNLSIRIDGYQSKLLDGNDTHNKLRLSPNGSVELKYPLVRQWSNNISKIEPIVQLVASPTNDNLKNIANDDSLDIELTSENLFSLNRSPGYDRIEEGIRYNYGVRYSIYNMKSNNISTTIGRVYRLSEQEFYDITGGFPKKSSDIVGNIDYSASSGIKMYYGYRLSKTFEFRSNRLVFNSTNKNSTFSLGYFQLRDFPTSNESNTEQVQFGIRKKIKESWFVRFNQNRNLAGALYSKPLRTSWALGFKNECTSITLNFAKDNTNDVDIPSSTNIGLNIKLFGF